MHLAGFVGLLCLFLPGLVNAAEGGNRGYISLEAQYVTQKGFVFGDGKTEIDLGKLTARTLQFDLHYNLTDRWSVSLSLPFVSKKYKGPFAHDPLLLDNPRPDNEFLDDGSYQNNFANFEFGVYRRLQYRDFDFTPFAILVVPSHNYETFGLAAADEGLIMLRFGLQISAPIGLSNFYTRGEYAYVITEDTPGNVNINHQRLQAELGYFLSPRWTARLFAVGRIGNGFDFPDDYPSLTDERWYNHDQTMSHEFINLGIGLEYRVSERYSVSSWTQEMVWGRNSNTTADAFYLQLAYAF